MKISIVMPLHNKGPYVVETLQSLTNQSFTDWEAVIVENNSSDQGPMLVEEFSNKDERIKLFRSDPSVRGPGAARNAGIHLANGEWILFLDSDDLILYDHLESLMQTAYKSSANVAVSNWLEFEDGEAVDFQESVRPAGLRKRPAFGFRTGGEWLGDATIAFAPWALHCALVKKSLLSNQCLWQEDLDQYASEDTAFWFRLLHNQKIAYSGEYTAVYRKKTHNFRDQYLNLPHWFQSVEAYLQKNLEFLSNCNEVPTLKQTEYIVRLWESLYGRATKVSADELATKALQQGNYWLAKCPWMHASISVKFRKILGLKVALWLSSAVNVLKRERSLNQIV